MHITRVVSTLAAGLLSPLTGWSQVDVRNLTATEAASMICRGELKSEALIAAYLKRAKARPELNAFVTLDETGALEAAKSADARRAAGGDCRLLEGVPIVLKDNIHAAGLPSTAGTVALKTFVPAQDAPIVARLRDAGAIILGKTTMHELAFGISGFNPTFTTGPRPGVRNAYDVERIAGGSSSGNGAALGARLVPAALGTDTGGSVRIPCALNGCVALRPTIGRYSQQGIAPISRTRDTAGPMAQTVADVVLMDRAIAGGDAISAAPLAGLRIGMVGYFMQNIDEETRAAIDSTLGKMKSAGVTVVDVQMPELSELNAAVGFPVALYEAHDDMVAYLDRYRTGVTIEQLARQISSPDVKGTYEGLVLTRKLPGPSGTVVDAAPAYSQAMKQARPALQALYARTFSAHRLDAIVFPTVPKVAVPATPESSSIEHFMLYIQNTDPGGNAGIPGLQVPIALGNRSGLPIGMELDGPAGSDRALLAIGLSLEKLLGRLPAPPER